MADIFGYIMVGLMIVFILWVTYWAKFQRWSCAKCGRLWRGHVLDCEKGMGMQYDHVGPCCIWRRISHAEYNRSFGIPNTPRRVK